MWQYLIVALIIAWAAYFVWNRFVKSKGSGSCGCGGGCGCSGGSSSSGGSGCCGGHAHLTPMDGSKPKHNA